jgi:putative FmdB family regulatory protein
MPIYEYRCTACDHQKEFLQRMSDAPLTDCPACGTPALTKLVSAAGFQLKGSGWYVTDFRNNDSQPKKSPGESAESAKKEESKSQKKEDSKSEAVGTGASPACT